MGYVFYFDDCEFRYLKEKLCLIWLKPVVDDVFYFYIDDRWMSFSRRKYLPNLSSWAMSSTFIICEYVIANDTSQSGYVFYFRWNSRKQLMPDRYCSRNVFLLYSDDMRMSFLRRKDMPNVSYWAMFSSLIIGEIHHQ